MNNISHEFFGNKAHCPYCCSIPLERYEVDNSETTIDWVYNKANINLTLSATCPECGSTFSWVENHIVCFTEDTLNNSRGFTQRW